MRRREVLALGVGGLVGTAGCLGGPDRSLPEAPDGTWTQRAHDPRNTGAADVSVPPRGNPAWDSGEAHVAPPLVDDGIVYTVDDAATALHGETGEERWERDLPGGARHAPVLTDDRLVVATDEALVALARTDGSRDWTAPLPRPSHGALTLAPDQQTVTVPLTGERDDIGLAAYDTTSGTQLWDDETVAARATAIDDDTVYVTGYRQDGDTGVLRALAVDSGSQRWETELDHPDQPPVLIDDGVLVADGGTLALHDPADGTQTRSLGEFGDQIGELPAVADGTVFVTTSDRTLVACSLQDGERRWAKEATVVAGTGVTVGQEAVVAAVQTLETESLGGIAAYERTDGSVRWEHEIEGFDAAASTPPIPADGAVFYASNESMGVVALGDLDPLDE